MKLEEVAGSPPHNEAHAAFTKGQGVRRRGAASQTRQGPVDA